MRDGGRALSGTNEAGLLEHALTERALELRFAECVAFLGAFSQVAQGRVTAADPPVWCEARGWTSYLRGLTAQEVELAEVDAGAWFRHDARAPESLRFFAESADTLTRLPRSGAVPSTSFRPTPLVKERKSQQIDALIAALRPLAEKSERVVDIGTGKGHLSRLASESWLCAALGLDRNERLLSSATALIRGEPAEYQKLDALAEALPLRASDLVLGLHACGEVTDIALASALGVGARMAFVSCCLQKQRAPERLASSSFGRSLGFSLSREVLGLSNLMGRARGIEVPQSVSIEAHQARHALRLLLELRGVSTEPGEEMRGVNRRRARKGLDTLAFEACQARGLLVPSPIELEHCKLVGETQFSAMRRWSLPRALLPRVIECAVAFDRAALLQERGHVASVTEAFPAAVSPRNILLVGVPDR